MRGARLADWVRWRVERARLIRHAVDAEGARMYATRLAGISQQAWVNVLQRRAQRQAAGVRR